MSCERFLLTSRLTKNISGKKTIIKTYYHNDTKAYSETNQTSMMELLAKIGNG